ncbi:hypothetical protein ES708_13387 [subsurface metagenome]
MEAVAKAAHTLPLSHGSNQGVGGRAARRWRGVGFYRFSGHTASHSHTPPGAWGGQPPPFHLAYVLANPSPHSL